jgi:hypothetical protein
VRVYKNLRRRVWSIQDQRTGLVLDHLPALVLLDVALVVSEATRLRVVRQHRRTVHAYAVGRISEEPVRAGGVYLHYNPFTGPCFTCAGEIVTSAVRIDFRAEGAFLHAT